MRHRRILLAFLLAFLWFEARARAQVVTEFGSGITALSGVLDITTGPDGNLWFTEEFKQHVGRITPSGVVTEFSAGQDENIGITAGPDGNLWFTEFGDQIGRI